MRCVILAFVLVCLATPAWSATYTVKPNGQGDYPTIQAAIDAAQDGDVILLKNGTFRGAGNRDLSFNGKAITVRAQSENPKNCVIDCEGTSEDMHRGFFFFMEEGPESVLEGVTITNGYGPLFGGYSQGGGLACYAASPTVSACRFVGNYAGLAGGGAVIAYGSSPLFTECEFIDNSGAPYGGGGVGIGYSCFPTFVGCTFMSNSSGGAGASLAVGAGDYDPSVVTMEDCIFLDNHSGGSSGGPGSRAGAGIVVINSFFEGNTAERSAGASGTTGGWLSFAGCTFWGNSAVECGGAVRAQDAGTIEMSHCTLYANSAPEGSAIALLTEDSSVTVENSILALGQGEAAVTGFAPTFICTDIYGNEGGDWVGPIADQLGVSGNISLEPHLVNPDHGIFYLKDKSPCAPFSSPTSECDLIGAWPVGDSDDADDYLAGQESLGLDNSLLPSRIAPEGAQVRYALAEPARIEIVIYDVSGRLTRHLVDQVQTAGAQEVLWDGRNDAGQSVSTGVYFSQLRVNSRDVDSGKIVLLR